LFGSFNQPTVLDRLAGRAKLQGTARAMPRSSIPTINEVIATRSAGWHINRSPPLREPAAESIRDSPQYVVVTADECAALIGRQGDRSSLRQMRQNDLAIDVIVPSARLPSRLKSLEEYLR
jgi:hypothetical protein